jgi:uncharacterized protein YjeT (DUF2065 family)
MRDLLVGIALVLVIEGVLWAGFPDLMRRAAVAAAQIDPAHLRIGGLACALSGVFLVWVLRH